MAVSRWSAEAMAEIRSLESTVPRRLAQQVRQAAQALAAAAGRTCVERLDVCEALARTYASEEEAAETAS